MAKNDLWAACWNADKKQHISELNQSRFFTRLEQCSKLPGVGELITTVEKVWSQVAEVTKRVSVASGTTRCTTCGISAMSCG